MDSNLQEQLNMYQQEGKKKKWMAKILAVVVLSLILVLWFVFKHMNSSDEISYETQKVTQGDMQVTVMATGNLNPTNSVDIGIEVSGTIKEIYVDFNDKVTVGQLLAKLDTTKLKAQVDSSKASLSIAKANLKESEVNVKNKKLYWDRTQKMFEQSKGKYPSQNDVDDAQFSYESAIASYEASKARVMQAEYNLKTDEENLEKAVVKSSINGLVLNRAVEVGQTVAASMSTPTLFTLAKDLSKMDLIVSIDEADVADIKEGLNVTFTVDAYPKESFKGKIKQVRFNPIEESGVITYETVALVENENLLLRPGMTASAKIITKELKNTLLVPNSALRFTPKNSSNETIKSVSFVGPPKRDRSARKPKKLGQGSFKFLYTLESGEPKRHRVKVLETDGKMTSIQSKEIQAGDEVITSQKSAS